MLSGCEFLGSLLAIIIKAAGITSASANARVPPPRRSAEVFLPERLNVSECVEGCACGLRVRVAGGLDLCCTRFPLCESGLAGSFHASNWYYWVGVCDVGMVDSEFLCACACACACARACVRFLGATAARKLSVRVWSSPVEVLCPQSQAHYCTARTCQAALAS